MNKMIPIEDIDQDKAPTIYRTGGLGIYLEYIREQVTKEIPDFRTAKGRARIASLAAQVSKSKVAIEKPGREYLKRIKDLPRQVEAELREFVQACDDLRDEVRQRLTDWENDEQARLNAHKNAQELGNSVNLDVFALLVKSGIDKESAKIIVDLASNNQLGALKIIY
jgi:hypothetical protein